MTWNRKPLEGNMANLLFARVVITKCLQCPEQGMSIVKCYVAQQWRKPPNFCMTFN